MSKQDKYADQVDAVREKYESRILALMERFRTALQAAGYVCDPVVEIGCDEYQWSFRINMKPDEPGNWHEEDFGIDYTIWESRGREDDNAGINFCVEVVASGGRELGSYAPNNLTPYAWVSMDEPDAVERRFLSVETVRPEEVVEVIQQELERRNANKVRSAE